MVVYLLNLELEEVMETNMYNAKYSTMYFNFFLKIYYYIIAGKLSHWIQLASNHDELIDFLLIDRSNPKRKVRTCAYDHFI